MAPDPKRALEVGVVTSQRPKVTGAYRVAAHLARCAASRGGVVVHPSWSVGGFRSRPSTLKYLLLRPRRCGYSGKRRRVGPENRQVALSLQLCPIAGIGGGMKGVGGCTRRWCVSVSGCAPDEEPVHHSRAAARSLGQISCSHSSTSGVSFYCYSAPPGPAPREVFLL